MISIGPNAHRPPNRPTCPHGNSLRKPCRECEADKVVRHNVEVTVEPWEPHKDSAYVMMLLGELHQGHADMYQAIGVTMTAPWFDLQDTNVMIIRREYTTVGVIITDSSNAFAKTACINDVIIAPQHRRNGYARAAIKAVIATMQEQGVEHVTLSVAMMNKHAMNLYRDMGFEPVSAFMLKKLPKEDDNV